ncbi:MAG: hypothetical protein WBL02_06610 [Methanomethylovorans sp.]|uniref:hypothetical protein n=1 Tax=Methanomethylovorans sp. TaxID=2758717 RepID=UPI003C783336
MAEFKDLQATAAEMYSNEEMKTWLFTHTRSEEEYHQIRRMLKYMASWKPVEWKGKTGERVPVEV